MGVELPTNGSSTSAAPGTPLKLFPSFMSGWNEEAKKVEIVDSFTNYDVTDVINRLQC